MRNSTALTPQILMMGQNICVSPTEKKFDAHAFAVRLLLNEFDENLAEELRRLSAPQSSQVVFFLERLPTTDVEEPPVFPRVLNRRLPNWKVVTCITDADRRTDVGATSRLELTPWGRSCRVQIVQNIYPAFAFHWLLLAQSRHSFGFPLAEVTTMVSPRSTPEPSLKPSILIVEDNETNVRLARIILEKGGYSVVVAVNGREGVEAAGQQMFDLILMDIQMPVMNGWEAAREIRRLAGWPGRVPIIALTASVMNEATKQCFEAGMDDSIGKPFKMTELIEKCQYWMNRRPVETVQYAAVVSS